MTSNPLVGTWKLLSWENRSLDGQVTYPLGEDAVGYISYTQDGYVFVSMMRSDRTQFTSGDLLRSSAGESARRRDLRHLLWPLRLPREHGRPPRGAQLVPQLGRCRPGTSGQDRGQSIDGEHSPDVVGGHPTQWSPHLGARPNIVTE